MTKLFYRRAGTMNFVWTGCDMTNLERKHQAWMACRASGFAKAEWIAFIEAFEAWYGEIVIFPKGRPT